MEEHRHIARQPYVRYWLGPLFETAASVRHQAALQRTNSLAMPVASIRAAVVPEHLALPKEACVATWFATMRALRANGG